MTNISPERLAVFEQILKDHKGVNSFAQRQRLKAALTKLGSVLTFELSRFYQSTIHLRENMSLYIVKAGKLL